MKRRSTSLPLSVSRRTTLMILLLAGLVVLLLRAVWLEVFQQSWLKEKADKRQVREVVVPPYRGMILDRSGEPVAVSSPVRTVTCNPRQLLAKRHFLLAEYEQQHATENEMLTAKNKLIEFEESLLMLAGELGFDKKELMKRLDAYSDKHFMYLAKQLEPEVAERILALDLPGVLAEQSYRRFYPASEMMGHVVGFTNIKGEGAEGVELYMNKQLGGQAGKSRVVRDGRGKLIENIEQIKMMTPGEDVQLSLDRRIQYVAYKELKKQVYRLKAQAGAVVVLDVNTGEVLAMANMPGFNPNNRNGLKAWNYRNRAVADAVEMGSTMKPLTIAAGLESGVIQADSQINTSPGFLDFGDYKVSDPGDLGSLSLSRIIARSSNVGASKIAMRMPPRTFWMFLSRFGLGRVADSGLANESPGYLLHYKKWADVDHAVMSYGYGISVSLLQMAQAYSIFGADGVLRPVTILKRDHVPEGQRVLSSNTVQAVMQMMEAVVVDKRGTGKQAAVDGYRVAGKTGTAYKLINKKYRKDKRITSFIGLAPVSNPKVVVAVMLDQPKLDATGGKAAAPVFSRVMRQALRVMDAVPDKYNRPDVLQANLRKKAKVKGPAL